MREAKSRGRKRYSLEIKKKAIWLRKGGRTHREIEKELAISTGSAYLWTKGITLTKEQKEAIQRRRGKKIYTPEYRKRISEQVRKRHLTHPISKYTKENLLEKIKDFHKRNGRMPLKREFNMHHEFKRHFKSWNSAIREAGFKPNPELFAHKFTAKDGHRCDSFTEKVIDDWLYRNKIPHQRNFPYQKTRMTADFLLPNNRIVEFFGLAGEQKVYDKIISRKRDLAKRLHLHLIEVYPKDIYPQNHLKRLLSI